MTDYTWLIFGLLQEEVDHPNRDVLRLDVPHDCVLVYGLGNRPIVMRFGCPYWIRIEGEGWGMLVSMESKGTFARAIRGDLAAAERDLLLLRIALPTYRENFI